jgi:hypothetical protein
MNQRFEIPVEPQGYNLFLIDDYLRTVRSQKERQKLIREVGYSAEKREAYERSAGLPRGAVELALLAEDKRVAELSNLLNTKLNKLYDKNATREEINTAFKDAGSRAAGIKALYPEAFQFLLQYNVLAKRNASMFRGDYRFNNEFKIMQVDCSPSSNVLSCGLDPVNVCVNVNLVVFVNAGVAWNVIAAVTVVLAFGFWIWAVAFVIP